MNKNNQKNLHLAFIMLVAFMLWTAAVCKIDVQAIGPEHSRVGLATVNQSVHNITGVNMSLYVITDWLSIIPICIMLGFSLLGALQLISRKSILKVDNSIIILGIFYIAVFTVYFIFEIFVVNYRPVLINGILEASYPSSTTVLVLCIMTTAQIHFNNRIKNIWIKNIIRFTSAAFTGFMVICRLFSGVHWITDIIGGILISVSLIMFYCYFINLLKK